MLIPKYIRIRDKAHLYFVRSLPCLTCSAPPRSEAAHIRYGSNSGMGIKPDDNRVVSLCRECHHKQHTGRGELTFWYKFGGWEKAVVLAKRLYEITGDKEKALLEMAKWKRGS